MAACSDENRVPLIGGDSDFDAWRGRGVVINYWAEWCAPCREEIPEFNELYWNSPADGPIVVGVNYDGLRGEELEAVIGRMAIEFPTFIDDPRERFGYARPMVMPTTILLDGSLNVKATLIGPQTAETVMAALATDTDKPSEDKSSS